MANIKSAKKRILVNRTKAARNKSIRSRMQCMTSHETLLPLRYSRHSPLVRVKKSALSRCTNSTIASV